MRAVRNSLESRALLAEYRDEAIDSRAWRLYVLFRKRTGQMPPPEARRFLRAYATAQVDLALHFVRDLRERRGTKIASKSAVNPPPQA